MTKKEKIIGLCIQCAVLAAILVWPHLPIHLHRVQADNPLTLNPTLYSCIKDNGVVSRTVSYDPQNGSNCEMIVSDGQTQTLVWNQASTKAFSGSILNWTPLDQQTYATALSGINQQPVIAGPNGMGTGTAFTTLKVPYGITHLAITFVPPLPANYSVNVTLTDGDGTPAQVILNSGQSVAAISINPTAFFPASDTVSLDLSFNTSGQAFEFASVSWTVQ